MEDLQSPFAAVERRLRPPQVLKCPRCESTNTKFCYYNNYNLSQPRHFCKGCRRYWTKGGVLRNVPVGGGCRKNKRASKSKPPPPEQQPVGGAADSSSESSNLTAAAAEAVSATTAPVPGAAGSLNIRGHEQLLPSPGPGGASLHALLGRAAGACNGLLTTATAEPMLDFSGVPGQDTCRQHQWQQSSDHQGLLFDQTVQVDLLAGGGGFGPSDWQMKDHHQGVYGLPVTVDQAYWSQQSQWTDRDQGQQYSEPPLPPLNFSQFLF